MAAQTSESNEPRRDSGDGYPLKATAEMLNERLGLYLSAEQQRGFAAGLLIGTALAGALLAWGIGGALRRDA